MILYAQTNGHVDTGYYEYARLDLTAELLRWLLECRPLLDPLVQYASGFSGVDFFAHSQPVTYGIADTNGLDVIGADEGTWATDPLALVRWTESTVAVPCVRIMQSGVLWSAAPPEFGSEFETPELSWEDLEAAARGDYAWASTYVATPDSDSNFEDPDIVEE